MHEPGQAYHPIIVPGLDVLIGDPSILNPTPTTKKKADAIYLPRQYAYRVMDFHNELSSRGDACKELVASLWHLIEHASSRNQQEIICSLSNGTELHIMDPAGGVAHPDSSKEHAVALAQQLMSNHPDKVAVMTGSNKLALLAALSGAPTAHVNPEVYKGRRKVPMPTEVSAIWWNGQTHRLTAEQWQQFYPEQPPLHLNEYVEFDFEPNGNYAKGSLQHIGRFNGEAIVGLRYTEFRNSNYKHIRPMTAGQAMLLDALLAPVDEIAVVIVPGIFGAGKTFLTVAAALSQVEVGEYERFFVVPRDSMLGRQYGYVPGDLNSKLIPEAMPIIDAIEEVSHYVKHENSDSAPPPKGSRVPIKTGTTLKSGVALSGAATDYINHYVEFAPLAKMGGRSINRTFIFYDEFQDTERYQAKALASRCGTNTKMVFAGDPHQITNPHLSANSNGFAYIATKLAGDPLVATISFDSTSENVRSPAARHIAERLQA